MLFNNIVAKVARNFMSINNFDAMKTSRKWYHGKKTFLGLSTTSTV